jgi:putative endonuclease
VVERAGLENQCPLYGDPGFESLPLRMYYVYVLWSEKLKKRYVGSTKNLEQRIKEHNSGKTTFTKSGVPWKLIYYEQYTSLSEARKREIFLKSGQGRKLLDEVQRSY